MIVYLSVMVGAYIFTRMFTAAAQEYKELGKGKAFLIQALSLLTAVAAAVCVGLIIVQSESIDLPTMLR